MPTSTGGRESCASNDLQLAFSPDMYSAYIEGNTHAFQLPAAVATPGVAPVTVKWTASDPSMVQIEIDDQVGGVMITTLRAGDVTITANASGRCGVSTLHITAATEEQWQAGNSRYNNMNPLPAIKTDGGLPFGFMNSVLDPPGMPPACTNCHGDTATSNILRTSSYTPEQTGGFSDQELSDIVTKGIVPTGGFFDATIIPSSLFSSVHTWSDITRDQSQGMVVYLRSLAPRPQGGRVDFGGSISRPGSRGATGAGGSTSGAGGAPVGGVPCGSRVCVAGTGSTGAPCCLDAFASQCGVTSRSTGACTKEPTTPP